MGIINRDGKLVRVKEEEEITRDQAEQEVSDIKSLISSSEQKIAYCRSEIDKLQAIIDTEQASKRQNVAKLKEYKEADPTLDEPKEVAEVENPEEPSAVETEPIVQNFKK